MRLHNLVKGEGENRPIKRVGRGRGNGHGKTSGRGHKGQKARAGSSQRPGFESGHIPLYRKLPKRGFNNAKFRKVWSTVNVSDLATLEGITEVNFDVLVKAGLVRKSGGPLKILGDGELSTALNVTAAKFTESAKEKIEKAGGKAIVVEAVAAPAADAE
ncbi:MAG: 50S ribosomal protein L15 [Opitutales bacterium]|nr:50S ribosomal protein L15 [Opitutales bacterium]